MINLQPYLKCDLVCIEPLRADHYDALYIVASDKLIWEQHPVKDRSSKSGFKKFFIESLSSGGAFAIKDTVTGNIIGSSRYNMVDLKEKYIEIGWTFLDRSFWGGTYNRAIKRLMVNYILGQKGKILLYVNKENIRSQKATKKIGGRLVFDSRFKYHSKTGSNLTFLIEEPMED